MTLSVPITKWFKESGCDFEGKFHRQKHGSLKVVVVHKPHSRGKQNTEFIVLKARDAKQVLNHKRPCEYAR